MRVLLILTALFSFSLSEAQVVSEQPDSITEQAPSKESGLRFFARGGVSLSYFGYNFEDTELYDSNLLAGSNFGVGMQIPLGKKGTLILQPELRFIQKGMRTKVGGGDSSADRHNKVTFRHNYIEIPIELMHKMQMRKYWMEYGLGGFVAWGIGGKVNSHGVETLGEYDVSGNPSVYSDKIGFHRFDAGFTMEMNIGMGKWTVGVSGDTSLTRFHKRSSQKYVGNKNISASFYLKYFIN